MRRIAVLLVSVLMAGVWPVASGVAHGSTTQVAPAPSLQADFNNDGADDLTVGVPFENLGSIVAAGADNVLYGWATGLTGTGSQLFIQDTGGVPNSAEEGDVFGFPLATGDFNNDTFADLAAGAPFEDALSIVDAGAVSALPGSSGGLTAVGGQIFTQDSPGVPGGAEAFDAFGFTLATGDPGPCSNGVGLTVGAGFEGAETGTGSLSPPHRRPRGALVPSTRQMVMGIGTARPWTAGAGTSPPHTGMTYVKWSASRGCHTRPEAGGRRRPGTPAGRGSRNQKVPANA
jgi:hypothetical protein